MNRFFNYHNRVILLYAICPWCILAYCLSSKIHTTPPSLTSKRTLVNYPHHLRRETHQRLSLSLLLSLSCDFHSLSPRLAVFFSLIAWPIQTRPWLRGRVLWCGSGKGSGSMTTLRSNTLPRKRTVCTLCLWLTRTSWSPTLTRFLPVRPVRGWTGSGSCSKALLIWIRALRSLGRVCWFWMAILVRLSFAAWKRSASLSLSLTYV